MSNIMVNGGMSLGHCYFSLPFLTGSNNVFISGKGVARQGDPYASGVHSCGDNSHPIGSAAAGFNKVMVDGKPIHRLKDAVSCGDFAGSTPATKVFTG